PNVGWRLPVRFKTRTSPFVTVPKAARTAWVSNTRVRSVNPSGPAVVHSVAFVLPMKGTKGVATSWKAHRSGDTPSSLTKVGSILVTSKELVPRMATVNVPWLPMFKGLGQDWGLMSTGTGVGVTGWPATVKVQSPVRAKPLIPTVTRRRPVGALLGTV